MSTEHEALALARWAVILYVYDDHGLVVETHGPLDVVAPNETQARTTAAFAVLGPRDLCAEGKRLACHIHDLDGGGQEE